MSKIELPQKKIFIISAILGALVALGGLIFFFAKKNKKS
jgi:hypothetical protein